MNTQDIYKKLDQIEKQVKYLKSQLKSNTKQTEELSPVQKAIKTITSKTASEQQVKDSLNVIVQSSQQLTPSQSAFALYFLALNRQNLSDDINWFFSIEVGKRKYNQRDNYLDAIKNVLDDKYTSNQTLTDKLKEYLESMKKK